MKGHNIFEIIKINLLYMNPQLTQITRKKNAKKGRVEKTAKDILVKGYLLNGLFMFVLYSAFLLALNFKQLPGYLDMYFWFFLVIGFAQQFTIFYNVFYTSKDIDHYRYLPVREDEVYIAKLIVVMLGNFGLLTPLAILFYKFFSDFGYGIWAVLYGFFYFVAAMLLILLLNIIFMEILARTSLLYRFKTSVIVLISVLTQVAVVVFIIYSQNQQNEAFSNQKVEFGLLSSIIYRHPNLSFVVILAVLGIGGAYIIRSFTRKFYDRVAMIQDRSRIHINKNKRKIGNLSEKFSPIQRYNLSLLKDPTVISTTILSPLLFPSIMLLVNIIRLREYIIANLSVSFAILVATTLSFLLFVFVAGYPVNLASVMCSLDNENFDYIKSLPFDIKDYLKEKIRITTAIMSGLQIVLILGISVFLRLPLYSTIIGLVLLIVSTYVISKAWILYDYRHVVVGWYNFNEIMLRISKFKMTLIILGMMIFGAIFVAIISVLYALNVPTIYLSVLLYAVWVAILAVLHVLTNRSWKALGLKHVKR